MRVSSLFTVLTFWGTFTWAFDPRSYSKQVATCPGVLRTSEGNTVVDLHLRYVDINPSAKRTILMVHGWPSLWSSWSNQIEELKTDYHLVVPDIRGFGESTHPGDVESSGTIDDIAGDMACILARANVESAICLGHDWGTQVCYEFARSRPDVVEAVIGSAIPYIPAHGDYIPMKALVPMLPKLAYQVFFSGNTSDAVKELDADIRRTIRGTLRTVDSAPPEHFLMSGETFLGAWDGVEEIPSVPFFSKDEEDYFVEQFSIQGFKNTLQFYTNGNRYLSWEHAHSQGNHTIPQPVLSILPLDDPVADWEVAAKLLGSMEFIPELTTKMLPGAHWVQLEYPREFNAIMREWLEEFSRAGGSPPSSHDEL
ncbi:alpha/beta-hydrolase [Pleurotus eryngii]|uniref:Alpha/beta-hydrolase n=1 Tax=Pleurotus eryngii TaxID=5323 RepID=A0A9P6D7U1_PLEER|nr:alpha/beta-hydrolase [Pleurotus eryngii]